MGEASSNFVEEGVERVQAAFQSVEEELQKLQKDVEARTKKLNKSAEKQIKKFQREVRKNKLVKRAESMRADWNKEFEKQTKEQTVQQPVQQAIEKENDEPMWNVGEWLRSLNYEEAVRELLEKAAKDSGMSPP